ncbi:hypothetical protein Tco_0487232 [Tanacetum coccineum]
MAKKQDKQQQQQQNLLDAELVPINEQVKIATSNFRIALKKTKPDVIYKVCLDILKQYSFYNAFIATADAPEIYMQQFWYIITYDLTAKAFFFIMGDKVFEVNADLLRNSLSITPKDLDHPFTLPAPEKEIIKFINQLGCSNIDFAELIWDEFKYQIESRRVSRQKQELMPFSRFTKLIIKYILSKHDQISKRPLYFHHVIKLDSTLGNIKFVKKVSKEPIFGMAIPVVMLNDDIKASVEYSEYLAKSRGAAPVKTRGKGLLTKQGVEIAMERVSIPKRIRSKTVTEEVGQSKGIDDDEVDYEETKEDEEPLLKGLETLSKAAQFQLHMRRAIKATRHDFFIQQRPRGPGKGSGVTLEVPDELVFKSSNEGAGVTPEVPDEPSDYSSSSSSNSELGVKEISSDEAEVTEKANNAKIVDAKKDTEDQVAEKQPGNKELGADQGDNKPAGDAQADVQMTKAQPEKPKATLISSHQTLSSAEFTSQFLNDNPHITVYDVLKDPVKPEVQSLMDILIT